MAPALLPSARIDAFFRKEAQALGAPSRQWFHLVSLLQAPFCFQSPPTRIVNNNSKSRSRRRQVQRLGLC